MIAFGNDFGGLANITSISQFNKPYTEAKDQDVIDLPPVYKKKLTPFESIITTAYVDEKAQKTIVYVNDMTDAKKIKTAIGNDIEDISQTSDDVKITLK